VNRPPLRMTVEVGTQLDPRLLQRAIAEQLAGRAWPGPERAVAEAVGDAVTGARVERKQPWR
jgi:hypothetical protein